MQPGGPWSWSVELLTSIGPVMALITHPIPPVTGQDMFKSELGFDMLKPRACVSTSGRDITSFPSACGQDVTSFCSSGRGQAASSSCTGSVDLAMPASFMSCTHFMATQAALLHLWHTT
ncbi:uncharacterized protein LOC129170653 isoform X2 [Dunckerocampus dactyliophorus]|uniref:uncharacterized protein LOC129170653 isoform X2 n=1 Tax=Dunckerocampus dactyliophorus TaxID=161453 RepID=UPI0024067EA1|nr:uncharacterized protein LOC129170653 isoform X2 [Dunckerocampus dactyliophorus]